MTSSFRKPILAALIAGFALSLAAPMASAQTTKGAQNCILLPDGTRKCDGNTQPAQKAQPAQKSQKAQTTQKAQPAQKSAQKSPQKAKGPAIGDGARNAALFQQAKNSRLPAPPAHQHYRVLDGTVVRVDDSTLKVVAVVGLLSAILNEK